MMLYLVRHGQTTYNVRNITQGWCDSELTDKGIEQSEETGKKLKHILFSGAYSGDLPRQIKTAEYILAKNHNTCPKLELLSELREAHYGSFEGIADEKMLTPIFQRFHIPYGDFGALVHTIGHAGITDFVAAIDPEQRAENSKTVIKRGLDALQMIAERHQNKDQILVLSSGGILGLLLEFLSTKEDEIVQPRIVANGSVNIVEYKNGQFKLLENIL